MITVAQAISILFRRKRHLTMDVWLSILDDPWTGRPERQKYNLYPQCETRRGRYVLPVNGRVIDTFRWRPYHPVFHTGKMHWGVDIACPDGTPVFPLDDGVVLRAVVMSGYGNTLEIRYTSGDESRYAHLSAFLVKPGDHVTPGVAVALSGHSGVYRNGHQVQTPHLHFELRHNGERVDPLGYVG